MSEGYSVTQLCLPENFEPLGKAATLVLEGLVLKRRAANAPQVWEKKSGRLLAGPRRPEVTRRAGREIAPGMGRRE